MHERLLYLLNKHLTIALNEDESREMRELLQTLDTETQIRSFATSISTFAPGETDPRVFDRISREILNAEKDAAGVTPPEITRNRFFNRSWLKYAAAVAFVVATAGYLLRKEPGSPEIKAARHAVIINDIPPGSNKAILTLADGSTILLDSAGNGELARQGNINIVKNNQGIAYYPGKNPNDAVIYYNTMSTPRSGQYQLTLEDGSRVWLNAASSITYPIAFGNKERKVSITGEAYLEVAHDKARPFYVKTSETDLEVLGTKFNINSYPNEDALQTTLLEGSVKVVAPGASMLLRPGQRATLNRNGGFRKDTNVDTDQVMAWKNGLFNFNHADLQTVMRQLERWYDIDVRFSGNLPARQIQGKMERRLSLKQVLKILEKMEINHKLEGRILTITP